MRHKCLCGLLAACALVAAACDGFDFRDGARKRVVVFEPEPPGVVDVPMLAGKLARETQATVETRKVDILSEAAIRRAAASVVAEDPALIVAPASDLVFALRELTQSTPILFVTIADPIHSSLVTDTQRPRGNVSGYSFHVPIEAKQLEIITRAFPHARRVGVLGDRNAFVSSGFSEMATAAHSSLGIEIVRVHFQTLEEMRAAVAAAMAAGVDAWVVPQGGATHRFAGEIVRALAKSGKPAIFGSDRFVRLGGLMSYSQSFEDPSDRIVRMAHSVLHGFPVGDLPVEHPQSFRFAINTVAWRAMNPMPPAKLLLLATEFHGDEER